MAKVSIKYVAEMMNGEYLVTMNDKLGYTAFTVADFGEANFYESQDDEILMEELNRIEDGRIHMSIGSPELKSVVRVEMKIGR